MKLNFSFVALLGTDSDVFVLANCKKSDLAKPSNFKKWECSFKTDGEYVILFFFDYKRQILRDFLAMFQMIQDVHLRAKKITCRSISD